MSSHFFDRHPEDVAEQVKPAEAITALRELEELSRSQSIAMDVYFGHWVLVVLLQDDYAATLELQQLCSLARVLCPTEYWIIRWAAFGDLLEGKRCALQRENDDVHH